MAGEPETYTRQGDHDGSLRVTRSGGDISISRQRFGGVTFCPPMQGGGRSPNTWKALAALIEAIRKDNQENPLS